MWWDDREHKENLIISEIATLSRFEFWLFVDKIPEAVRRIKKDNMDVESVMYSMLKQIFEPIFIGYKEKAKFNFVYEECLKENRGKFSVSISCSFPRHSDMLYSQDGSFVLDVETEEEKENIMPKEIKQNDFPAIITEGRKTRIYLAAPYTKNKLHGFSKASQAAGCLMDMGYAVFSPVTHGHVIEQHGLINKSQDFWMDQCIAFLSTCDALVILDIDGHTRSDGVNKEKQYAKENNMPIYYLVKSEEKDNGKLQPDWVLSKSASGF